MNMGTNTLLFGGHQVPISNVSGQKSEAQEVTAHKPSLAIAVPVQPSSGFAKGPVDVTKTESLKLAANLPKENTQSLTRTAVDPVSDASSHRPARVPDSVNTNGHSETAGQTQYLALASSQSALMSSRGDPRILGIEESNGIMRVIFDTEDMKRWMKQQGVSPDEEAAADGQGYEKHVRFLHHSETR